jgi:hypothetical protein
VSAGYWIVPTIEYVAVQGSVSYAPPDALS